MSRAKNAGIAVLNRPEGATRIGYKGQTVKNKMDKIGGSLGSVADLITLVAVADGEHIIISGYHQETDIGGGRFYWDQTRQKADHDGGAVISPTVPWDGTATTLPDFLAGTGETDPSGQGAFVRFEAGASPVEYGSIPGDSSATAMAANNAALQAYANYCLPRRTYLDFSGFEHFYNATLDLTGNVIAKIRGDTEDANNNGRYNLIYLGSGTAISARELIHEKLGLAGTASIIDPIPAANVGIAASQSIIHLHSCIRNFDTIYKSSGGFYNRFFGGRLNRARNIYDFRDNPSGAQNVTIDCHHTDFVNGLISDGGTAIKLGGSWEKFTRSCLDIASFYTGTKGAQGGLINFTDMYIENYYTADIAAGITDVSGTGKYIANWAIRTIEGNLSGTVFSYMSGVAILLQDITGYRALEVHVNAGKPAGYNPQRVVDAPYIKNNGLVVSPGFGWDGTIPHINTAAEINPESFGHWTDTNQTKVNHAHRIEALENGWSFNGSDYMDVSVNAGAITLSGIVNGAVSTGGVVATVGTKFKPKKAQKFVVSANNAGNLALVSVDVSGAIRVTNLDGSAFTASVARLNLTYHIR